MKTWNTPAIVELEINETAKHPVIENSWDGLVYDVNGVEYGITSEPNISGAN